MKKFKSIMIMGLVAVTMAVPAFAGVIERPVEIFAELTGLTVEEAWDEIRDSGKTFGELAIEKGVEEQFQLKMQENNTARINELLEEGLITGEQADEVLANIDACTGDPGSHDGTLRGLHLGGQGYGNGYYHNDDHDETRSGLGYGHGGRNGSGMGHRFGNDD